MHLSSAWVGAINVALSTIHVSVSVANDFDHSSTAADQGYHSFGELARFVYCLLQKIKKASSLPLVEQSEEYMVPNHSRFPAINDKNFLVGTRVMAALGKVGNHYLVKKNSSSCPSISKRFRQLCPVNRCCKLRHWTGFKLLLSYNCGWWGRCCSFTTLQQTLGWAVGGGLDQGERG